jgi:sirohydrochlorin cobaltochelatase
MHELAAQLRGWLGSGNPVKSSTVVGTAQLELAATPLHVQISDFARHCTERGITRMVILPLFLIPGVHVMVDIPAEVALAAQKIGGSIELIVAPFLGSNPDFASLFAQNRFALPRQTIILAHGSRRTDGNTIVAELARDLDATVAYWSIAPSLVDQVTELITTGAREIGILPYFLFAGGITDSIEQSVAALGVQHPQVKLILVAPIGNSLELVSQIGKILSRRAPERESKYH